MQFIFDPLKDELNVSKHGISLDQASVVFNHPKKNYIEQRSSGRRQIVGHRACRDSRRGVGFGLCHP